MNDKEPNIENWKFKNIFINYPSGNSNVFNIDNKYVIKFTNLSNIKMLKKKKKLIQKEKTLKDTINLVYSLSFRLNKKIFYKIPKNFNFKSINEIDCIILQPFCDQLFEYIFGDGIKFDLNGRNQGIYNKKIVFFDW